MASSLRLAAMAVMALATAVDGQSTPVYKRLTIPDDTPARSAPLTVPVYGSPYSQVSFVGGTDAAGLPLSTQTIAAGTASDPTWQTVANPVQLNDKATIVSAGISGTLPDARSWALGGVSRSTGQLTMTVAQFDGATWTPSVATTGIAPVARTGAAAVYVPQCNGTQPGVDNPCIVMFGGTSSSGLLNDVWMLWLATTPYRWERVAAAQTGAPSARTGAVASLSSDGQYAIFYGGVTATGSTNDVYMFAPSGLPDATINEMTNVALPSLGAVASESSTDPTYTGPARAASAIDGYTATLNGTQYVCTHSLSEFTPWWRVDLGRSQVISSVQVFPRSDCCQDRLTNYRIVVGDDPSAPWSASNTQADLLFMPNQINQITLLNFRTPLAGRYVWVYLVNTGTTNNRILSICEFKAFTKAPYAWRLLSGKQNVALLKPAAQSSIETAWSGSAPSRAVDGGRWNSYDAAMPGYGYTCAHTAAVVANTPVWWRVDLGAVYDVSTVNVWGRLDCCNGRNTGVELYIGNSLDWRANSRCNWNGNLGQQALPTLPASLMTASISCPTKGRYVTFRKPNLSGGDSGILALCEVEVMAQALSSMPDPMRDMGAVFFRGNMVLFGGVDNGGFRSNSIRLFNVDKRVFLPAFNPLGDVPIPRAVMGLTAMDSSKLMVFGGTSNSDVLTDALTLAFPACPAPANWDVDGVLSKKCTGAGTSCVFTCGSQYNDMNKGKPVVCREDGIWQGTVPPCQAKILATAPTNVQIQSDASSVNVTWAAPTSLGMPFGTAAVINYAVTTMPDTHFERFVNGFENATAWRLNRPDVPTTSSHYFTGGRLQIDAATHGVQPVNPVRKGYVLYRDWPANVDPNGEWTIEVETEIVQIGQASGVSIGLWDVGIPGTNTDGSSTGGEMHVMYGFRYTDSGDNGAPTTLSLESMGGRVAEHIPLPQTMPRKVQLRIERSVFDETDREGNPIYRFWYRFHGGAQWVRYFTTLTLYDTLWSPLSLVDGVTRVGRGMIPSNLRPCFFTKTWNGNQYARTTGAYSYLQIFQGLSRNQGLPQVARMVGPATTFMRFAGLSPATTYTVRVAAVTQAGAGAEAVFKVTTGPAARPAPYTGPVVNAALRKTAFASSSNLGYGPLGPAAVTDGLWDTRDTSISGNMWHSNTANIYEWVAVDLGVPYAAVKSAFVVNRCQTGEPDSTIVRLRHFDFFVGSYGLGPRMDNVMTDYSTWGNGTGPMLTSMDATMYAGNHKIWPPRTLLRWNYNQGSSSSQDCQTILPVIGYGRYAYMLQNAPQYFHIRELNFFTANSCPARTATGNGWIVPAAPAGTRSCAAASGFGAVCEFSCPAPATVIVGATTAVCNGEMWWSASGNGAAPYCGVPCPDLAAPAFVDTVSVEMINENWASFPTSTDDLRYRRFTSMYPWGSVWSVFSIVDGALQATSRIGAALEASAVFSYTKASSQIDYSTTFSFSAQVTTSDAAGLYFRVVDENNWYRVVINPVTGYHVVEAMVGGMVSVIGDSLDNTILPNTQMTVAVSALGPAFNISVNGRLLIQGADRSFTQGIVGLYARSTATFRTVLLTRNAASCSGLTEGETCVMSCQGGLRAVGPARRQCILNGGSGGWAIDPVAQPFQCVLDPPSFPGATITVKENAARNTLVGGPLVAQSPSPDLAVQFVLKQTWWGIGAGAVPAQDNSLFTIDSCTGQVRVRTSVPNALDYELQRYYLLTVSAYVPGFPSAYTDRNITVQLLDVDEPPIIIQTSLDFPENGGVQGSLVGLVNWWDPENNTVAWTLDVDGSAGRFTIVQVGSNAQVRVAAKPINGSTPGTVTYYTGSSAPLSFEGAGSQGFELLVKATQVTGDTTLSTSGAVTVRITDVNDPPIVPKQLITVDEAAAAAASATVVGTIAASDEDVGVTTLSYTQVNADVCSEGNTKRIPTQNAAPTGTRLFAVNSATGAITIAAPPPNPYPNRNQALGVPYYPPFIYSSLSVRAVYTLCMNVSDGRNVTTAPVEVAILANDPGIPRITSWTPSSFNTTGGTNVTFFGSNLYTYGTNKAYRASVSNGYTNLTLTGTPNNPGSISFFPPAGVGQYLRWIITIDGEQVVSSSDIYVSYNMPYITSVSGYTAFATSGNSKITISGQQFGNTAKNVEVYYGPTGWEYLCTFYGYGSGNSQNTIVCTTSGDAGGENMQYRMRIGAPAGSLRGDYEGKPGVWITGPELWSYAKPTTSTLRVYTAWAPYDVTTLPTQGGLVVQINGTQYGGPSVIPVVTFGGPNYDRYTMSCSKPILAAIQQSMLCITPPGTGRGHGMMVSVGGNKATGIFMAGGSKGLGYATPTITRIYGEGWQNANTEGGQVIIIEGTHFGPVDSTSQPVSLVYGRNSTDVTRYAATDCRVMTAPPALSTMQCVTAPGVGSGLWYRVTIDGVNSAAFNGKGSYGAPSISSFAGVGATGSDTVGGDTVIITGKNFGPLDDFTQSQLAVFYGTDLQAEIKNETTGMVAIKTVSYTAANCAITKAHTEITCQTAIGAGTNLRWDVVMSGQRSATPTTTYAPPLIQSITDNNGSPVTTAEVNGGSIVFVRGRFFGPSAYIPNWSLVQEVSFGLSGTEYVVPRATLFGGVPDDSAPGWSVPNPGHSVIRVRLPPGFGTGLFFRVTVADQVSTSDAAATFSYRAPEILAVTPNTASTYSDRRQPTRVTLTTRGLPFLDTQSRVAVLFGNAPYQEQVTAALPVGLDQLVGATNANTGYVSFNVELPENGGGLKQSFQLTVTSSAAPINAPPNVVSPIGPTSEFNYNPVNVQAVVVTRARFAPAGSNASLINNDLIPCPFSASDPVFTCNDPLDPVYQMTILGTDFTSATASAQKLGMDGLVRSAELLLTNDTYLGVTWSSAPLRIYTSGQTSVLPQWEHTKIVIYSKFATGTLRLRLSNKPWDSDVITQEIIRDFRELNPEVTNLAGPTTGIPTAGGTASDPLIIDVSNLAGCVGVDVFFGPFGNRTKGTILDSTSASRPYPALTTDAAIKAWVDGQLAAATLNGGVYKVYVQIPAGQGKAVPVVVSKRNLGSSTPIESNSGYVVQYAPPVLRQVQTVISGVAGPIVAATPTTVISATTEGLNTRIRLIGDNLGTAPRILAGDSIWTPSSAISACAGYTLYTCYEFTAPWGEGDGQHIPGSGGNAGPYQQSLPYGYRMLLEALDQDTDSVGFAYATPIITQIRSAVNKYPTRGGVTMRINGANFGATRPGRPVSVKMVEFGYPAAPGQPDTDWLACTNMNRVSHTYITCTLPPGVGKDLYVRLTMADIVNPNAALFSYDAPVVTNMTVYRVSIDGNATLTVPSNLTAPLANYNRAMLTGKAAGGDLLYLTGANFGPFSDHNCAFFMWAFRPTVGLLPKCDGNESFWGEGEIPSDNVVRDSNGVPMWDHELIVLRTPPGIGWKDVELSIRGRTLGFPQLDPNIWRFQYEAPIVRGFWSGDVYGGERYVEPQGPPKTLLDTEGEQLTIFGESFGPQPRNMSDPSKPRFTNMAASLVNASLSYTLPTANIAVVFHKACLSIASDLFGATPTGTVRAGSFAATLDKCERNILRQEDNRITLVSGSGIGKDREAYVVVVDGEHSLASLVVPFSYHPPQVNFFQPQVVRMAGRESSRVEVYGRYYGDESKADLQDWSLFERTVEAEIGGIYGSCRGGGTPPTRERNGVGQYLKCNADETILPAGVRNVSVTVAGQTGRKEAVDKAFGSLLLVCEKGFYGRVNETCLPCPAQDSDPSKTGAACDGYYDDEGTRDRPITMAFENRLRYPRPLKGWYNLNSSDSYTAKVDGNPSMLDACPDGYRGSPEDRTRDVCIVPCDPPESCLGDNHCAEGYTSKLPLWRCAYCDKGYYKRAGECIKCPDSPAALFVGFILLVIVVAGVGFALNRKQINVAVISIGVDFFQVLAIFAQARIKWPPVVKELLHVLSAFNLNIEIVAPECLIPDVSYKQKFWFIMLLPLCIAGLFSINYISILAYKALIQGQPKKTWHTHKPAMVSSCLVLLYLLYLYLTRTIFDVFNCAPTFPPTLRADGSTILYLQVVFPEECGIAGGTQMTLIGYAIAGLIVYTAGYPLFIGWTLFKNRELVMEDQLLRAKGTGQDKLTNPRAYDLRITYGRSYFQFKPDYCLWILAIILRKFFIAITAVVFGKNSSFQMAACLLIMFLAYAAQVQIRPYMSPADFEEVMKSHVDSSYTSAIHARLRASIAGIESRGRKKAHKNLINFEGKIDRAAVFGVLMGFFFNYNTVEAIMSFCAVIVCLMAIMYQANELNSYYPQSKDSVTSVVLIIVIWAIVYFFTVFATEIMVLYNEDVRTKQLAKAAKAGRGKDKKAASDEDKRQQTGRLVGEDGELNLGKVETGLNPMFLNKGGNNGDATTANVGSSDASVEAIMSQQDAPPVELWRVFQSSYVDMNTQVSSLRDQLMAAKKQLQTMQSGGTVADDSMASNRASAKSRTQFAPKSSGDTVNPLAAGGRGVSMAAMRKAGSARQTSLSSEE